MQKREQLELALKYTQFQCCTLCCGFRMGTKCAAHSQLVHIIDVQVQNPEIILLAFQPCQFYSRNVIDFCTSSMTYKSWLQSLGLFIIFCQVQNDQVSLEKAILRSRFARSIRSSITCFGSFRATANPKDQRKRERWQDMRMPKRRIESSTCLCQSVHGIERQHQARAVVFVRGKPLEKGWFCATRARGL